MRPTPTHLHLLLLLLSSSSSARPLPLTAIPPGTIVCETASSSPPYSDGLGLARWILGFGAQACSQSRQRVCTAIARYGAAGARLCSDRDKYDFECGAVGRAVGWVVEACRRGDRSQGRYVFDRGAARDSAIMLFSG